MQVRRSVSLLNCFRGWGRRQEARARRSNASLANIPEVFEGRVDVEAAAVHVSNIGSRQFHFGDGQTCSVILRGQKTTDTDL